MCKHLTGDPPIRPLIKSHLYPLDDWKEHILHGTHCPCKPEVIDGVVAHHAFDGRDLIEEAEERFGAWEVRWKT